MNPKEIDEGNAKVISIKKAVPSGKGDKFKILMDGDGASITLSSNEVETNGIRIAISALQSIPAFSLPVNPKGNFQCHFKEIEYKSQGETKLKKKNGTTPKYGKYTSIDDGLVVFNKGKALWVAVSTKNADIREMEETYLVMAFPTKKSIELLKEKLDELFPFERFGKQNRYCYGYFYSEK